MNSALACAYLDKPTNSGFRGDQGASMAARACPFCCSGRQQIFEVDAGVWAVYCVQCDAVGPHTSSKQDALARWGHRCS
jgi:hypothetical protein